MSTQFSTIVQRIRKYCNLLRDKQQLSVVREVESAVDVGLVHAGRV